MNQGKAGFKPRGSLPLGHWPAADRAAWEAECKPSVRLERGGRASHLKPVSKRDFVSRYGVFLDFLHRTGRLDASLPAGAHVTRDNVEAYLSEARARVSSVTLYNCISKLRRMAKLLAPQMDLTWLAEIEKDLAFVMAPRSKADRLVLVDVLLEAGLTLIAEANMAREMSALVRARQHRNGLMVAMLALHPIRLKNYAALEIGRTFVRIKGAWWIILPAADTKEARPDERPVDPDLWEALDLYLQQHRKVLARSENPPPQLWLSQWGRSMSYSAVENALSETTRSTVGVDVSPHLFRTSLATTAAVLNGDNLHLGSAVLHHTNRKVTDEHYNRGSSLSAQQAYLRIIKRYRSE